MHVGFAHLGRLSRDLVNVTGKFGEPSLQDLDSVVSPITSLNPLVHPSTPGDAEMTTLLQRRGNFSSMLAREDTSDFPRPPQ